jgi:hypothetical protein
MCREKSLLCFLKIVMVVVLLLLHHHENCDANNTNNQTSCTPSSCGKINNIKHPFRLKNDPTTCGDPMYELSCENNITILTLFSGKYYVKSINYKNYTIRLVDTGIQENDCSTIPRYFLTSSNFTSSYNYDYHGDPYEVSYPAWLGHIIYLNCSNPVKNDRRYVDTSPCIINSTGGAGHVYAVAGDLSAGRLNVGCHVKLVATSSASAFKPVGVVENDKSVYHKHFSYKEIHEMLSYGFYLSWLRRACEDACDDRYKQYCYFNESSGALLCSSDFCKTPLGLEIQCGKKTSCFHFGK